jgi:hypothetical protein
MIADQHQPFYRGNPMWQPVFGFRQIHDVLRSVTNGFRLSNLIGSKNR